MKRFFVGLGRFLRKFWGILFALAAFIYVCVAIFEPELRVPMIVAAAVCTGLAWLLLTKKKPADAPCAPDQPVTMSVEVVEPVEPVEPVDAYIRAGNVVYRTDGQPISDREVPYLIETGYQEAVQREMANPWRRTEVEQELIFRFTEKHGQRSDALTSKFDTMASAAYQTYDLDEKAALLTAALQHYQVAKEWHYKISKGGMMWFQDMWERGYAWFDTTARYLGDVLRERDYIRPHILQKASGGFIQKDIYSELPDAGRADIQRVIKQMEVEGLIIRTKKGNSYLIEIAK